MRIKKFQPGGAFNVYTPAIPETNESRVAPSGAASDLGNKSPDVLTTMIESLTKELVGATGSVLANEWYTLTEQFQRIQNSGENPMLQRSNQMKVLKLANQINTLKQNKAL